jgi:hypothetical protein
VRIGPLALVAVRPAERELSDQLRQLCAALTEHRPADRLPASSAGMLEAVRRADGRRLHLSTGHRGHEELVLRFLPRLDPLAHALKLTCTGARQEVVVDLGLVPGAAP